MSAQEEMITIDPEALQGLQQWAQENLDENVLNALGANDEEQVKRFFEDLQKRFHGEYVVDLAELREISRTMLPLLEGQEETQPYAIWLKNRIDILEVAEELRLRVTAPPGTNEAPARSVSTAPQVQREVWVRKISKRPMPAQAGPYVKRLKPVFARHGLPPELVWIAEVESSFDPRAKSPAGAAGLFQLMPATAKQYGLRTWPVDQRFRPDESADAAARHLAYLYRKFGDWRLATAAYNAGEGTVQRAMNRRSAKTFDAIAPVLPAETQMYVPKLEAVLKRREGVELSRLRSVR